MQLVKILTNTLKNGLRYRHLLYNIPHYFSSTQASVRDILQKQPCEHTPITVKGWVQALRDHSDITFINVSDGSCSSHLQVVLPSHQLPSDVTLGCCVEATGTLKASIGKGQASELVVDLLHIVGSCDSVHYPFKARQRHTAEYVRQFLHLRARTKSFSALLRLRSAATLAVHQFFQNEGYCNIHTPIITANDCEGAGEVFTVQPWTSVEPATEDEGSDGPFFGVPAYLTVSGQLHLEATTCFVAQEFITKPDVIVMYPTARFNMTYHSNKANMMTKADCSGFDKVYTFSPTFRAENASGRHHLNEFYMIEAELAFTRTLEDLMQVIERLTKSVTECLLSEHQEDMSLFTNHVAPKGHKKLLEKIANIAYIRMSYTEAIDALQKVEKKFEFKPTWGCDLQKEHERHIVEYCGGVPVFVTDFPTQIKAFYARQNTDPRTVACVDLLAPGVGELCGGSLREERYDVLKEKLDTIGSDDKLDWYLDLRRFGSAPHGGFGVGFERYLQTVLGIANIKDTIPFPRSRNNCKT